MAPRSDPAPTPAAWLDGNKADLAAALDEVRYWLERHVLGEEARPEPLAGDAAAADPQFALGRLCERFGLSAFERRILLLAVGLELDGRIGELAAGAGGATFALALSAFPGGYWDAIGPTAPLRHWRLIEVGAGHSLVQSPLRVDEYVLGLLLGQAPADPRLLELSSGHAPVSVTPSQMKLAERLAWNWREAQGDLPILQLTSDEDPAVSAQVAMEACALMGLDLIILSARALPHGAADIDLAARLCERHARVADSALLLDCDGGEEPDAGRETAIARWVDRVAAPLFLTGRKRRQTAARTVLTFDLERATTAEQRDAWLGVLGPGAGAEGDARRLAAHFDLATGAIAALAADARATIALEAEPGAGEGRLAEALWDAARRQVRPRLDDLAQRVRATARWSNLILPEPQLEILRGIQAQLSQRPTVHDDWGFAEQSERGLGLTVLFAGSSGTGKTTAAEVLARELRLDLYRVDLSAVVSKYIGETEKNLRRVFDAAEAGGCILLFDEADALFGKRTEVSDSHDRHANVEVSYLLQRVEMFRGLAILTSNMRSALDAAFLRRLRFIVNFPFPDAALRAEIWRRAFPAATPTKGLDVQLLAQLNLSGGQIRTVALNAAFLAASAGTPVGLAEIRTAVRMEYAKQDKALTDAELKGWPA